MLRRLSWRPHQRKQHARSRQARDRTLRRELRPRHDQKARIGTYEAHQCPSGGRRREQRTRDNQDAASRVGVGPPHTIEEVTEGDEVMEKRGRQDGITTEQAKGRTQRWQPLLPNLQRVNEAARSSGQTRFTALRHHVDVAALERAFRRQRRAASPGMDGVTVDDYERELEANLRRLHDSVHSGQYWPKPWPKPGARTTTPKADGG